MAQPDNNAIEMVGSALEMEEKGKAFYAKALAECKNALGRDIFSKLKADEDVHIERIREIYNSLTEGGGWTDSWKSRNVEDPGLKEIFQRLAKKHGEKVDMSTDDLDALQIGMEFEQKAVAFYEKHFNASSDELEKEFARRMIEEERGHYAALADMKFYIENPEAWFEEKGRSMLDGA